MADAAAVSDESQRIALPGSSGEYCRVTDADVVPAWTHRVKHHVESCYKPGPCMDLRLLGFLWKDRFPSNEQHEGESCSLVLRDVLTGHVYAFGFEGELSTLGQSEEAFLRTGVPETTEDYYDGQAFEHISAEEWEEIKATSEGWKRGERRHAERVARHKPRMMASLKVITARSRRQACEAALAEAEGVDGRERLEEALSVARLREREAESALGEIPPTPPSPPRSGDEEGESKASAAQASLR